MILDDAAEKSLEYSKLVVALAVAHKKNKTLNRFKKKVMNEKSRKLKDGTTYQKVVKGGPQANAVVPYAPDGSSSAKVRVLESGDDSHSDDHDESDHGTATDDHTSGNDE